ncbi:MULTISPECIES: flagellar biosynthesis protein FlhB [unclassified Candidatus Frackibacter]|uniref:flagellar biosynthesis protein FlhB n=1 Tax=unclassified Candidatus Frackibacter TaxID=2648818 RepID=UPI0007924F53|nr:MULTISPECIES: flagellar biosynthesis protein FlhB [unclassified Candidatus Frackibacter]KXS40616.1 MAG: flagellar biosynthetic protein FlhB [Candidatus Frackibacter sp. T328-2]SDB99295.1 flagellar biosynthetic protein FlhB [Candidatus Frackibacter sp. WG11]SEM30948.1 flagellar biosynthetic protein FlhB [Candidatus Frackibacter sp. WG12]SFL35937.1 flagellar biosynthetic protein FlhB [Candidatus Frackibacter sp. WG13]
MPAEEKTEEATPKRRQEAREEGQVAKSQDLSMAFTLLFSFIVLFFLMNSMIVELSEFMTKFLSDYLTLALTARNFHTLLLEIMRFILQLIAPIMVVTAVIGSALGIFQTGFLFTPKAIQPKISKLNPISGFKNMFSKKTFVEFLKSLLKISIVGVIAYLTIKSRLSDILLLGKMSLDQALRLIGGIVYSLAIKISIILIILGVGDFIYQKWQHEQDLKMTKQQVKEERKQTEGSPEVQKRIKEEQQKLAMNRMMSDIPDADVVITNPTHIAVAIKFDMDTMEAPVIIGKGKGEVAQKIKEKAKEHDIEIVEEKPLARALYAEAEIGQEIPVELYQAVAEILAYVYQLNNERGY